MTRDAGRVVDEDAAPGISSSSAARSLPMSSRAEEAGAQFVRVHRACEHSMRLSSASFDISSEKTATTLPSRTAAFSAMLMAKAVLPIEGRAAMMIRSDFCRPLVISSRSV